MKKLFCTLLVAALLLTTCIGAFAYTREDWPFSDVWYGDSYYEEIAYLYDNGLYLGETQPDGKVAIRAKENITRAEFVYALYVAYGNRISVSQTVPMLTDIATDSVFYDAIYWAVGSGIAKTYDDGKFYPNDHMTRLFEASALYAVADTLNVTLPVLSMYSPVGRPPDIDDSTWANYGDAIMALFGVGIPTKYFSNWDYNPNLGFTRERFPGGFYRFLSVPGLGLDDGGGGTVEKTAIFVDVPDDHWGYGNVESSYKKGLIDGVKVEDSGNFRYVTYAPEETLTKAQVAQFIFNAYHAKLNFPLIAGPPDVPDDAWYYAAVQWVVSAEIVDTNSITNFRPNDPATRDWFVDVLYRAARKLAVALPEHMPAIDFSDITNSAYTEAIIALCRTGVINGFPDSTFRPTETLTRAQLARAIDLFTDIEGLAGTGRN